MHRLEQAAGGTGFHVNADKTEFLCFNQKGATSTLNSSYLKLVDKFNYLGSSVSSTKSDINMHLAKAWTTATRVQILDEIDCISHSTNTLGNGMNPIILPPAMGK